MKNIILDERLGGAAELVPEDSILLDVGTDHGYLPAWLLLEGKIPFAGAADINEDPLSKAVKTAAEYGVSDRMSFYLSDGMNGIADIHRYSAVSICGMGGELIARIISQSDHVRDRGVSLILQPMSSVEELSMYLAENGFTIIDERVSRAAGKLYRVILARYDGVRRCLTDAEHLLGAVNIERGASAPNFALLLLKHIKKYKKIIKGREQGGADSTRQRELLCDLCRIAEKEGISYDDS